MCGICITWLKEQGQEQAPTPFTTALDNIKARGPDVTTVTKLHGIRVGFTRLHIQGDSALSDPEQPYLLTDGRCVVCNGEIFNSAALIQSFNLTVPPGSSDCAVIPALLERGLSLSDVARQLDGDFAIVVITPSEDKGVLIQMCRDPYGVRPLYYNSESIASELKGLVCVKPVSKPFVVQPGTVVTLTLWFSIFTGTLMSGNIGRTGLEPEIERWHEVPWLKHTGLLASPTMIKASVTSGLRNAVEKRLTTVRGLGACLSGGLDSSIVAAIAQDILQMRGKPPLHTYSIGMSGSADLAHARLVAEKIHSHHHECILTPEECLAAVPNVIRAIESFDITTVRASVGNYLLGKFIASVTPDVKVILNGDGADELFGGYLYMRKAPSDADFEMETTRLLTDIHTYDVLRSERCMAAHGLESRSPFLDRQFVSVVRGIPTEFLRSSDTRIEKLVLRESEDAHLLPDAVRWRRKEAFSDGISGSSGSWFEMAKQKGEQLYPGAGGSHTFNVNPPKTAEALWYRNLFHKYYPLDAAELIPAMWMPRWVQTTDPSARTLTGIY